MRRKPKTYTLKSSVILALEEEAKRQSRTRSQIVEMILEEKLINNKPKQAYTTIKQHNQ